MTPHLTIPSVIECSPRTSRQASQSDAINRNKLQAILLFVQRTIYRKWTTTWRIEIAHQVSFDIRLFSPVHDTACTGTTIGACMCMY